MLKVSDAVVGAFERSLTKDEVEQFASWWGRWRGRLGTADASQLAANLANAQEQGPSLGIDDNRSNRLYMLAAAIRLIPEPDARQYLLIADVIFDSDADTGRIDLLASLALPR